MDKTSNTKYIAQVIAQLMQSWIPVKATDPDSQHEITQLRQQVPQLRQRVGDTQSEANPPTSSTPSTSSTSLASHGGIPSHYVLNPEPHLRAISYRTISHPDSAPPPTASHPSIPLRGPEGHRDNDMPAPTNPPPPRPKQASCSTAPRSLSIPPPPSNPDHTHS